MKLLHLTPTKHVESIMAFGIKPTWVKNQAHFDAFSRIEGRDINYASYFWNPDTTLSSVDKIIRDFIYCKYFIHPRNEIFDENEYIDFSKMGDDLIGNSERFTLLEINASEDIGLMDTEFYHTQSSGDNKWSTTCMLNDRYAHDDKVLHIGLKTIKPEVIKIKQEFNPILFKDNTIGLI